MDERGGLGYGRFGKSYVLHSNVYSFLGLSLVRSSAGFCVRHIV